MPEPDDIEEGPDSERPGAKQRSGTAYPYYGLATALSVVEAVRRSGGNEAPNSAVMAQMGVPKTTDRRWAYGIPAAIQFGLIERIGRGEEGRIKLTDLAIRIALPTTPEEGMAAKVAAFRTPPLYSKLLERFAGHPIPQKEGLRNLLHREFGIVESMAPNAAEAFLDSLKDAGLINANNSISVSGAPAATVNGTKPEDEVREREQVPPAGSQMVTVPADFIVHTFPLRRTMKVQIPLPVDLTKKDVERLKSWMGSLIFDEDETSNQETKPS